MDEDENLPTETQAPSSLDIQLDIDRWVPPRPRRNYRTNPFPRDREVVRKYFEIRPTVENERRAIQLVALEMGRSEEATIKILTRFKAKEEAKIQRREYADEIYAEKIPMIKNIVSQGLNGLCDFIEKHPPVNFEEARQLSSIVKDMNNLLRLELEQPTAIIDLVEKTQKTAQTILGELAKNDPFVDYVEAEIIDEPTAE